MKPLGNPYKKLVEYGFARFHGGGQEVIADEPLPLLAAAHHFRTTSWNLSYFMTTDLCTNNDSARGFAFEYFCAYLLGLAFKSPTRLSDIFTFLGPNNVSDQVAQLVAVYKDERCSTIITPVDISSNHGPGYTLGHTCRTDEETLSWFEDPQRTVFCFPNKSIGPDFVLLLQLCDKTLLRVLVQCKHISSKGTLGSTETFDAFRTTDPRMFIAHRNKKKPLPTDTGKQPLDPSKEIPLVPVPKGEYHQSMTIDEMSKRFHIANPQRNSDLQTALNALGPGTNLAGDLSVLRVLIAHPASPHLETIRNIVKADKSNHPAAIVDLKSLANEPMLVGAVGQLEKTLHATFNRFSLKRSVDEAYGETVAPVGMSSRRKLDTERA